MISQEAAETVHWFIFLLQRTYSVGKFYNLFNNVEKNMAGFLSGCLLFNLLPKIKYHWFLIG
jgi:hypothetical protein